MSRTLAANTYEFDDKQYAELSKLVYQHTGIVLGEAKKDLTYSRFSRRIRNQKISGFAEYLTLLRDGNEAEINALPSVISTNVTSFYREPHHFDFMSNEFALNRVIKAKGKVRIWSSASSTGQEPYSIAASLLEALDQRKTLDLKILATDIDPEALQVGKRGIYPAQAIAKIPKHISKEAFDKRPGDSVEVKETLRKLVHFKRLNLLNPWPMKGPFDVIFCRNVVIYFDEPTKRKLYKKFASVQRPGDFLIVGHSESLMELSTDYECLGHTVYVRK